MNFREQAKEMAGVATQMLLPGLLQQRLGSELGVHVSDMTALRDDILSYTWHGGEHGWNSLLGQHMHGMDAWQARLAQQLRAAGIYTVEVVVPGRRPRQVGASQNPSDCDGMALAARLMTDFEALDHQLAEIWRLADGVAPEALCDTLLGLSFFYQKAAGFYRRHLCLSATRVWDENETGVELGE
ncbi:MAG: hypothetical protein GC129_05125 [Proteobacteria bacterium]|nr:hypothetical protein [Pseudomonadota bacterium]